MPRTRIRKHIKDKYGEETADKVAKGELEVFKNGELITNLKDTRVDSDENYLTFKPPKKSKPKPEKKTSPKKKPPAKTPKKKPPVKTPKKTPAKKNPKKSEPAKDFPSKADKGKTPKVMTVQEFLMLDTKTAVEVGRIEAKAAKPTVDGEFVHLDTKVYVDDGKIVNSECEVLKFKVIRNSSAG